jgi:hypothetical protein
MREESVRCSKLNRLNHKCRCPHHSCVHDVRCNNTGCGSTAKLHVCTPCYENRYRRSCGILERYEDGDPGYFLVDPS